MYRAFLSISTWFSFDENNNIYINYVATVCNSENEILRAVNDDLQCSEKCLIRYSDTCDSIKSKIQNSCQSFYQETIDDFIFLTLTN